jgi:uncharacterized membrane protein YeaQ/YmgE (transglycosylase-associated protein family)
MKLDIGPDEIITWLLVGALAGSLTGMLIKGRKEGFGHLLNLAIGLVGALIGGYLFKVLHVNLGLLGQITISLQEVVAALVGSLIFLAAIWLVRRQLGRK